LTDGPKAVLRYLSRFTHRVAIANRHLIAMDDEDVTFRWKDYRTKGRTTHRVMTQNADESIRQSLLHTLPMRFQRIRHYGFIANDRTDCAQEILCDRVDTTIYICPDCRATMVSIEILPPRQPIRVRPDARNVG
jgi:hypothetical protein